MRLLLSCSIAASVLICDALAYAPPQIPAIFPPPVINNPGGQLDQTQQRAQAVKDAFRIAWAGYEKYALPGGHDELRPMSNGFDDSRNGWGATAVDALDTAIIMEHSDIVETILEYIPTIDYDHTQDSVSLFETTIRYLAGMLSGYDLLTGPYASLTTNATAIAALKSQSKRLADNLKFAFNTATGIPANNLNLEAQTTTDTSNGLATIGSLVLEWTRLSDILGDSSYGDLAAQGESYLLKPQYQTGFSSPWPGLLGTNVDIASGKFKDATGGWNGGDDSYYEYLIKMYVYDSDKFATYRDSWIQAADSTMAHLASHPSTASNLTFLASYTGTKLSYSSGHLACFDGGNFILGGTVLKEQKYVDFGLNLTASCRTTYDKEFTHIGPEAFGWIPTPTTANPNPTTPNLSPSDAAFYQKNGFWNIDGAYILRPEVLESYYYAYRATGDAKYQQWSWEAFVAINNTCAVGSGFSEINDVNQAGGHGFKDVQDTFYLAEALKYAYMIQAPDNVWQVASPGKQNSWVFNTEAHPFKVAGTAV